MGFEFLEIENLGIFREIFPLNELSKIWLSMRPFHATRKQANLKCSSAHLHMQKRKLF